jgi:undecaprenyl-diphosphatase
MTVAMVCAVAFALLTIAVALHPAPFWFDRAIAVAVQSQDIPLLNPLHQFVDALAGSTGVAIGAALIVGTFLLARPATPLVALSALYAVIYNCVNFLIRRPRPTGLVHTVHNLGGFSYPSGHVGLFVWVGVLVLLLARRLPRPIFIASCGLVVIVVLASAYSRVYVGAHWPSDVLGGLLLSIGWIAFVMSFGRLTQPVMEPGSAHRQGAATAAEETGA